MDLTCSRPTLSYQRLRTQMPLSDAELYDKIRRTVTDKHELQVLESFMIFRKCARFSYWSCSPAYLTLGACLGAS